jgi:hypothetical protein
MMKQTARCGAGSWLCRALTAFVGVGAVSGSTAVVAHAQEESPSKASCAQAYESAQESRAAGQLQETQTRLSLCARPECPSFVQKDCARWLGEVERELPSIIVKADGLDADAAISVKIDGNEVAGALGGQAITLDPGRHELVADSPGRTSVNRVIVAQQGVQNRVVSLDFAEQMPARATTELEADTGSSDSTLRPYAYVAWGVGAVGLGAFAVLGTLGRADERGLKDDCPSATTDPALVAPGVCLKSRADDRKAIYEREFVLADVGLVTGIIGAAAGTVLFVLAATEGPSSDAAGSDDSAGLRLDLAPRPGGGYATVGGSF